MASSPIDQPRPSLRISFCMDIRTSGAREGLLISTGVLASGGNDDQVHPTNPLWSIMPTGNIPSSASASSQRPIQNSLANDETTGKYGADEPSSIGTVHHSTDERNFTEMSSALEVNERKNAMKEDDNNLGEENNDRRGRRVKEGEPTIRLNLFEGGNGEELVPLRRPPSREGLLTQFGNNSTGSSNSPPPPPHFLHPNPSSFSSSSPLLCDSTTTTTTLEIFRPKADSADFFQLPKGPLSFPKEPPVLIIPAKGPEYERMEKSETRFEDKIRRMETVAGMQPQKSVQWGDSIAIHPPSSSSSPSSPSPDSPDVPPSHQQQSPPIQSPVPIVTSPLGSITSPPPDYLTILRRQQQEHNERTLFSPPGAECPPRPPKRAAHHGKWAAIGKSGVPPRPPKPDHLKARTIRERSQSADPMDRIDGGGGGGRRMGRGQTTTGGERAMGQFGGGSGGPPVRSASSNEIFKLYQTRDCLGRIVCEW